MCTNCKKTKLVSSNGSIKKSSTYSKTPILKSGGFGKAAAKITFGRKK